MPNTSSSAPPRRTGPGPWGAGLWGAGLAAAGGLLGAPAPAALGAPARPAARAGGGYTAYGDPRLGYALDRPAGWSVRAEGRLVVVQSPDRGRLVLVEAFDAAAGESAQARLQQPTARERALFPGAALRLLPSAGGGAQAAGALTFTGGTGPEEGRVLCRVVGTKGLIFAIAAPAGHFAQAQPVLTHVVKSLRFLPAARAAAAPDVAAIKRGLHFVTWTEPKEHAFHIQVPRGWAVEGGAFRLGVTDVRMAYQATSPGKDIAIVFGDQALPPFEVPSAITEQLGERELQPINESPTFHPVLLHYMAAPEFSHWYLDMAVSHLIADIQITGDRETPGAPGQPGVSAAMTEFTGRSVATGKKLHGLLNTVTSRGSGGSVWNAAPEMIICDDDGHLASRFPTALVAYLQMKFSYAENADWVARRRREIFEATGQQLALTARVAQQNALDSDARENALMGAFRGGAAAQDAPREGFADYVGDRQAVVGADGTRYKVSSGEKYHYQDSRGTILSTSSAYSPGVDWTPMTER